jgi:flagellar protein FlaG
MEITAINGGTQAMPASAPDVPVQNPAETRETVQAVKALNQSEMFGSDNELVFQRDETARRMVIRVINRNTKEVVSQIPPEYILRLAQDLKARS